MSKTMFSLCHYVISFVTVSNTVPYRCCVPRHSNEAAMKTNGTVATVLASKSRALIDMVMDQ